MDSETMDQRLRHHATHHVMAGLWQIRSPDDHVHTVDLCEKMVAAGGNEQGSPLAAITHRLQDVIATYEAIPSPLPEPAASVEGLLTMPAATSLR